MTAGEVIYATQTDNYTCAVQAGQPGLHNNDFRDNPQVKMATSNGTTLANGNGHAATGSSFTPSDGIEGRWEGVVRPYSQKEVRAVGHNSTDWCQEQRAKFCVARCVWLPY